MRRAVQFQIATSLDGPMTKAWAFPLEVGTRCLVRHHYRSRVEEAAEVALASTGQDTRRSVYR